jgi:hypothetical protein
VGVVEDLLAEVGPAGGDFLLAFQVLIEVGGVSAHVIAEGDDLVAGFPFT